MSKVLIVDDDEDFLFLLSECFKSHGVDFDTARNAAQARYRLKNARYRVVVSDFSMPGESGLDLYRYVSAKYPGLRFILMSGNTDPGLRRESLRLGIGEFVEKPFRFSDLVRTIVRPAAATLGPAAVA